jgi:hypothetical protein
LKKTRLSLFAVGKISVPALHFFPTSLSFVAEPTLVSGYGDETQYL